MRCAANTASLSTRRPRPGPEVVNHSARGPGMMVSLGPMRAPPYPHKPQTSARFESSGTGTPTNQVHHAASPLDPPAGPVSR
jgi:hypothetical protein